MTMLPPAWSRMALATALEALYVAALVSLTVVHRLNVVPTSLSFYPRLQEVELQQFSPQTRATAAIYAALHTTGLADMATATLWLLLVRRFLHVDLTSVRQCFQRMRSYMEPTLATSFGTSPRSIDSTQCSSRRV